MKRMIAILICLTAMITFVQAGPVLGTYKSSDSDFSAGHWGEYLFGGGEGELGNRFQAIGGDHSYALWNMFISESPTMIGSGSDYQTWQTTYSPVSVYQGGNTTGALVTVDDSVLMLTQVGPWWDGDGETFTYSGGSLQVYNFDLQEMVVTSTKYADGRLAWETTGTATMGQYIATFSASFASVGSPVTDIEWNINGEINDNLPSGADYWQGHDYYAGIDSDLHGGYVTSAEITVVPEPATIAILGLGGLLLRRKRA